MVRSLEPKMTPEQEGCWQISPTFSTPIAVSIIAHMPGEGPERSRLFATCTNVFDASTFGITTPSSTSLWALSACKSFSPQGVVNGQLTRTRTRGYGVCLPFSVGKSLSRPSLLASFALTPTASSKSMTRASSCRKDKALFTALNRSAGANKTERRTLFIAFARAFNC